MTEQLHITLDGSRGALIRVLGTVERRGWTVRGLDMPQIGNAPVLRLEIERGPWHGGTLDVLERHLGKLFCVTAIARPERATPRWSRPQPAPHAISVGAAS